MEYGGICEQHGLRFSDCENCREEKAWLGVSRAMYL